MSDNAHSTLPDDPALASLSEAERAAAERVLITITRTVDRTGWSEGPWDLEGDLYTFYHFSTDQLASWSCKILRNRLGSLCGYVCVRPGHPAYGLHYNADMLADIDVHGGLSFAGDMKDDEADDLWWFGFDCGHAWDLSPGLHRKEVLRGMLMPSNPDAVYRDLDYVATETRKLADQLLRMMNP